MINVRITNPAQVTDIVQSLDARLRQYNALEDKCFEGFEHYKAFWPKVMLETPKGQPVTIFLPEGDCGVLPEGLPWGWTYGTSDFIHKSFGIVDADRLAHNESK